MRRIMLLGYNTNGFAHHRLEDALLILNELGYRSVALTLDYHALNPFDVDCPRQLAAVKAILRDTGMRCVIETGARFLLDPRRKHQPTLLSEPAEAERRFDFLRRAIDIAAELSADAVSFWSGAKPDNECPDTCFSRLVDACTRLSKYADERSMRIGFEPEPGMFVDTMDHFSLLHAEVGHPRFGLTLDIGHLYCQGEVPVRPQLLEFRDCLWNVHLEDMRRGVHDHLMFGTGEIDFVEVMAGLRAIGYAGGVHVELSRHSHDAVNTARQSLEFLRRI
jgi:sugar phosphate isomerase/epimerase